MKTNMLKIIVSMMFLANIFCIVGCGGGGGGGDDVTNPTVASEGVFLDSAVKGLNYKTDTQTGFTDNNGTFKYLEKEVITFSIGTIILGQTTGKSIITPINLVDGATDASNDQVTNICRLLQTLDNDGNVDNGISITEAVRNAANGLSIDFNADVNKFENTVGQFVETLTSLTSEGKRNLISANDDDGDNYTEGQGDCDDNDATIHPDAIEICGDGIDQDCDGSDLACLPGPNDTDDDGDNYTESQGDCDDNDATIHPDAIEICGDGIDQDCDGSDLACDPTSSSIDNEYFSATIKASSHYAYGFRAFSLFVKNKSNKDLELNWNKTYYIVHGQTSGGFMFEGIVYIDRNDPKSPDIIFSGGTLSKTIWPNNLVEYTSYWRHEHMPSGENGIYLTVIVDGKEINEKIIITLPKNE